MTNTEQNERQPSEAELLIVHGAANDHQRAAERAAVREAAKALNSAGWDAYAAMVASIAENERLRDEEVAID